MTTKKKKVLIISLLVVGLLSVTIGVTYAFFNYTRIGAANTISVGRISFVTRQTKTISLSNLFPIDPNEPGIMNDTEKVSTFEIEIVGDTDYSEGIEYLVSSENTHITTPQGKLVPISLDVEITNLGTENDNYFTARESKNTTIYKKIVGDILVGDGMILVGYIKPNTNSGEIEGVNGKLTIKAYLDKNKILISDTYDGTESDINGTPNTLAEGKTVLTTDEWNALQNSGASFQIRVEANPGIWVNGSLEEIMRKEAVMDNISSEFVSSSTGINFGAASSNTNGKGVYIRKGTENNTYPIMYYRGEIDNNNVLFNNKCWKAVRTTDTGGVKMIYNGEPKEVFEQINIEENGYTVVTNTGGFIFDSSDKTWNATITSSDPLEISFSVPENDNYKMVVSGVNSGGSYLFLKDNNIVSGYGGSQGSNISYTYNYGTLSSSNTVGIRNSSGASVSNPLILKIKMIYQGNNSYISCDNTESDTGINLSGTTNFAYNQNMDSPAHAGYMYGTVYSYSNSNWGSDVKFGSGFTWDGTNYQLTNADVTKPDDTHHYSCNSADASETCTSIRYVYYAAGNNIKNYITLSNGEGVEQALEKMQVNEISSTAKTKIDSWYMANMTNVTNKLEDTIWCNDRSIGYYHGWSPTGRVNPSGNSQNNSLNFGPIERSNSASDTSTEKNKPSLQCPNKNDAFTVSNAKGNGKLSYPVAMLTSDEMVLAGGVADNISTYYLNGGSRYWSLSPSSFYVNNSSVFSNDSMLNGQLSTITVSSTHGIRPAISLNHGTPIVSGDGTVNNPFVIK